MFFTALITIGAGIGLTIGALSHPLLYSAVFRTQRESADHDGRA